MRNRTILAIVAMFVVVAFPPTTAAAPQRSLGAPRQGSPGDAVLDWNANAGQAAIAACIAPTGNPLHESRMYAMMHVAIHDALNAIDRRSDPYVFHGRTRASGVSRCRRGHGRARRARSPAERTP